MVRFQERTIDIRKIPGTSANKVALNTVKMYFGTSYMEGRLVEPSGNAKSNKIPMSPEKTQFLKGLFD